MNYFSTEFPYFYPKEFIEIIFKPLKTRHKGILGLDVALKGKWLVWYINWATITFGLFFFYTEILLQYFIIKIKETFT